MDLYGLYLYLKNQLFDPGKHTVMGRYVGDMITKNKLVSLIRCIYVDVPDEIKQFEGEYVDDPGLSSDSFVVVVTVIY